MKVKSLDDKTRQTSLTLTEDNEDTENLYSIVTFPRSVMAPGATGKGKTAGKLQGFRGFSLNVDLENSIDKDFRHLLFAAIAQRMAKQSRVVTLGLKENTL